MNNDFECIEGGYPGDYAILLSDEAVLGYSEVQPESVYERIGSIIDCLANHPYYGQYYDPYYESAFPPVPCRVFYCGGYGVYYHVNDPDRVITILAIESHWRNPLNRFTAVDGGK